MGLLRKLLCCCNPCIYYCFSPIWHFLLAQYHQLSVYFNVWKRENSVKHYLQILQGLNSMAFLIVYIIGSFIRQHFVAVMVLEYIVTVVYVLLYIAHPPFYFYNKDALLKAWKEFHASRRAIWENLTCKRVRKQKRDRTINHITSMLKSFIRLCKHTIYTLGRNPFTVIELFTIPFTICVLTLNMFTGNRLYRDWLLKTLEGVPLLIVEEIRVARGISVLRLMVSRKVRSVGQQVIIFMLSLAGLVCVFACMLDVIENIYQNNVWSPAYFHFELRSSYENWDTMTVEEQEFTGLHGFLPIYVPFYTIICVQTLGSEVDVIINNYASKLLLVVYNILFFFIVAQQSATLYNLINKGSSFFDKANVTGHFIIECSEATAEEIQDFLVEFYNPAHGVEARAADVLLVLENDTKVQEMQGLTSNRYFAERVTVHVGDIREWSFFDFISADRAEAIFIFVNPNARNPKMQDTVALMKAMAITSFSQVKVYSMVIDPKHVPLFKQAKVQSTLCVNDMKLKMMTKSLIVPGFSTIIGNLVHAAEVRKSSSGEKSGSYWVDSYLEGIRNELYVVQMFAQRFWGMLFHEISREVFENMNCLLIGVVHRGEILLNPSNDKFRVSSSDKPIIIARDLKAAQRISVTDDWEDEDDGDDIRPEMAKSPTRENDKMLPERKHTQYELDIKRLSGQIARRFSLSSATGVSALAHKKKEKAEKKLDFEIRKIFNKTKPVKREEFMLDAAKGLQLENHFILMGDLSDALFIIFSIRKQLANKKSKYTTRDEEFDAPIILMGESEKKAQQLYEKCKYFENVFFFLGDSTDTVDLKNIFVEKAASIMYLTTPDDEAMTSTENEAFIDGRVIRTVLALQHIDRNLRFIVEIVHKHSLVLLQDYKEYILARNMKKFSNVRLKMPDYVNKRMEMAYLQSVLFASGQALVTRAIFPRLFCQSYFMPDIVEVVERMCGIIPSEKSKLVHMVKPPQQLIGKTFFEVFEHMLKYHRAVLLAWYCGLGSRQQPYVFIAPDRNHPKLLAATDQLYVVGRPDEEDEKELVSHLQDNDPFKFGDVLFRLKNRHGGASPMSDSSSPMAGTPSSEQFLLKKKFDPSQDQDSIQTPPISSATPSSAEIAERSAWSESLNTNDAAPKMDPAPKTSKGKKNGAKGAKAQKGSEKKKSGGGKLNAKSGGSSPLSGKNKKQSSPTAATTVVPSNTGKNDTDSGNSSPASASTDNNRSLSTLMMGEHHSASQSSVGSVSLPNRIRSITPSQRNLFEKYQKHTSSSDSVDSSDINLRIANDVKKSPLADLPAQSSSGTRVQLKVKIPDSDEEETDEEEELTD